MAENFVRAAGHDLRDYSVTPWAQLNQTFVPLILTVLACVERELSLKQMRTNS
jgi:hypothetical protein